MHCRVVTEQEMLFFTGSCIFGLSNAHHGSPKASERKKTQFKGSVSTLPEIAVSGFLVEITIPFYRFLIDY